MKLVDGAEEQRILEELLDETKPPVPAACQHLHYLFFTPFRYSARQPTRYRPKGEQRGVYYAAETIETAAAELAFYRALFFLESPETEPPRKPFELTAFTGLVSSERCLDIHRQFSQDELASLSDPIEYGPCHRLAENVRDRSGEIIRFPSVRAQGGTNLAVFGCSVFREARPRHQEGWWFTIREDRIFAAKRFGAGQLDFPYEMFGNDPRIAELLDNSV